MRFNPSVSLNNEKICRELIKDKMQFVRKLRLYGNSSDLKGSALEQYRDAL